jgi:hypothetical protein
MGFNPFSGRGLAAVGTLGLSEIIGEDTRSKIPLLGPLTGAKSNEYNALLKKQEQMAKEAALQREQQRKAGLQSMSQQMMAFAPRNQMMAQMFGPEAAFTPQQFANMASDPNAKSFEEATRAYNQSAMGNPIDPNTRSRTRGAMNPQVQADFERAAENERRKQMIMQNMGPLPSGPAPIRMPTPQRGRR